MDTNILKEYLDQVIIKMDFLPPVDFIDGNVPPDLQSTIMLKFPILEPRDIVAQELQISSNQGQQRIEHTNSLIKEWNYYGREREKQFRIAKDSFFIVYKKYESFAVLKEDFLTIVGKLFSHKTNLQFSRMGLRYINIITDRKVSNIFNWDEFKLNKNLLTILKIPAEDEKLNIARAFQVLEMNYSEFNLRFQYGMHNPDFPAAIRQKQFTLDFDAYYQGLLSKESDLNSKIDKFHDAIKKLIERC